MRPFATIVNNTQQSKMPFRMVQWDQLMLPVTFFFYWHFWASPPMYGSPKKNLINVIIVLPYCIFYHVWLTKVSLITELKKKDFSSIVFLVIPNINAGLWLFWLYFVLYKGPTDHTEHVVKQHVNWLKVFIIMIIDYFSWNNKTRNVKINCQLYI